MLWARGIVGEVDDRVSTILVRFLDRSTGEGVALEADAASKLYRGNLSEICVSRCTCGVVFSQVYPFDSKENMVIDPFV